MTPSTRFRVNSPKVVHEIFDDEEVVIINLDNGNYYSLDDAGALIWSLVADGVAVGDVIGHLGQRYVGRPDEIEAGVRDLVTELRGEDLIVPNAAPPSGNGQTPDSARPAQAGTDQPPFAQPTLHKYTDMQDLLLLDPIHDVDEMGWPVAKPEALTDEE